MKQALHTALAIRVLGPLVVLRGERSLALPPSKKTRALLAYLAVTGRPHRRERLCSLLWDVTDDPRGALRWSLSKLRALVDDRGRRRLHADRDAVTLEDDGVAIDWHWVQQETGAGLAGMDTDRLTTLERAFRGEFLEGLELPDFLEFQSWCVAQREQARLVHAHVLAALVERAASRPEAALDYARRLVEVDPFNAGARGDLVRLLLGAGRPAEARQQYDGGLRLLRELGSPAEAEFERTCADAFARIRTPAAPLAPPPEQRAPAPPSPPSPTTPPGRVPLIGRTAESLRLQATCDAVNQARTARVLLLTGEPGVGKTRLLADLAERVAAAGGTVMEGAAYELERNRPYGAWIDAVRCVPATKLGATLGAALAPLLPELERDEAAVSTRDRLYGGIVELLAVRAHSAPPVLVSMDDAQWLDAASVELLHYAVRMNRYRPLLVALAARSGELLDNLPLCRAIHALRRLDLLADMAVGPLGKDDTVRLVRYVNPDADGERVFAQTAGNPLFTVALAQASDRAAVAATLADVVRDRIAVLSPEAADVVRWAAVVGPTFHLDVLRGLTSLGPEAFVAAVEAAERHGIVRAGAGGGPYRFVHTVLHAVVYGDISVPRRRLMHQRAAALLLEHPGVARTQAAAVAHHAALADDAALAVRACREAGERCLRLFAATEAGAFARRGLHFANRLPEPECVTHSLELLQLSVAARRPRDLAATAARVQHLAERALDLGCRAHARLGFKVLSHLRWEAGDCAEAQRQAMRAEFVSRAADESERVAAMGEAARCLATLERELAQAEALAQEARAVGTRLGIELTAVPMAIGLLRMHEGRFDEAAEALHQARAVALRDEDHAAAFEALARLAMLHLQAGHLEEATRLGADLVELGTRVRNGSEAPFARAVVALCDHAAGHPDAEPALDATLQALRDVDAKFRLGYILSRAARIDVERGDAHAARTRADEALRALRPLGLASEVALAQVTAAHAAATLGDQAVARRHVRELARYPRRQLSAEARAAIDTILAPPRARRPVAAAASRR